MTQRNPQRQPAPRPSGRARTSSVRGGKQPAGKRRARRRLAILFTCVGRRIELLRAFKRAADELDIALEIHGADINRTAPAMHFVDEPHFVPRIENRQHIPALLKLVREERIDAIIPLIDSDLEALSRSAARFARAGARAVISDVDVIQTCADKLLTFEALSRAGVDTPRTLAAKAALLVAFSCQRRKSAPSTS